MQKLAVKRILVDLLDIMNEPIDSCHIFFEETDVSLVKLLIIGPENTPYEGGFYMFTIQFTNKYPFESPKVRFENTFNKVRFHPNLYENGKVCLSILGTWSGPPWTSVMNLRSLIITLQSLFQEQPITAEPGFENESFHSVRSISYNRAITYYNWIYSINRMLSVPILPEFNKVIEEYYCRNISKYEKRLDYLKHHCKPETVRALYAMKVHVDYSTIEITYPKNN